MVIWHRRVGWVRDVWSPWTYMVSVRVVQVVSSGPSTILNVHNHKGSLRRNNVLLCLVSLTSISWTGLAPYKPPRALDSLLIYQQPSSTTLYYSHPGILTLIEVRSRNETGEITCVNALARVAHLASSGPSTMLNTHDRKGNPRHNNALLCLANLASISWTDLATYKSPRAIAI